MSDVLLARGVGDALLVSEAVDTAGVAALARATGTAVDDDLSVKADRGRVLVTEIMLNLSAMELVVPWAQQEPQ